MRCGQILSARTSTTCASSFGRKLLYLIENFIHARIGLIFATRAAKYAFIHKCGLDVILLAIAISKEGRGVEDVAPNVVRRDQ